MVEPTVTTQVLELTPERALRLLRAALRAYEQSLIRLRDWYEEWPEIAHVAIKRRDLLVRMGLAKQQRGSLTR